MSKRYEFPVIIEKDEDGVLIASVPSMPGCHTHAKTLPTLMKRIKEAMVLWLEVEKDVPHSQFIGLQAVEIIR